MIKVVNVNKEDTRIFSSICVEICAHCNRRCEFCPVSVSPREKDFMPDSMFKSIVEDLAGMKWKGRFAYYIYNEPTIDPRLPQFVEYTRSMLPGASLMISTNGNRFKTSGDIAALLDVGMNQMAINVYSNEKRYLQLKGMVDEISKYYELVDKSLYSPISSKHRVVKVVAKFPGAKLIGVDHISNRAGNIPGFVAPVDEPLDDMCTRPFRVLNVTWQGNAILCCNDYYGKTSFGNVKERSLVDLWNDPAFHIYRLKLQNKDRHIELCDVCDFNNSFYPHMIYGVTFGKKDELILKENLRKVGSVKKIASRIGSK